jgi:predicted DNA-binding transcriptional regulator YafY
MSRKARLAALIAALSTGRPQTLSALAERIGQREAVLRRDLDDLLAAGYPIEGDGVEGFAMSRLIELPAMILTENELDSLRVAVRRLAVDGNPARAEAGARLSMLIDTAKSGYLGGLDLDSLTADVFGRGMRYSARHLPALRRAIRQRRYVSLTYIDDKGAMSTRAVRPLGLERWAAAWAVIGWCEMRDDFRTFRLDQISALAVQPESFDATPGRELADFVALFRSQDRD